MRVRLADVGTWRSGGTPPKDQGDLWDGGFPWISTRDLKRPELDGSTDTITEDAASRFSTTVPAGSLLIGTRGMALARRLPVAMATRAVAFNQDIKAIEPHGEVYSKYLLYAVLAFERPILALTDEAAHGTKRLDTDLLRAFRIPCPPRPEQERIARFLDVETVRIDKALSRAEGLRILIEERTASVRERLLASTPVATLVPLRRLATVQTGLTLNAGLVSGNGVERPYLRVANVQPGSLALDTVKRVVVTDEQIRRHSLMPGDVLMTEGGDRDKLGRGVVWRGEVPGALHQNHVFAVRPDTAELLSEYLEALLASVQARRYFESTANQTTNLASTNTGIVGSFPLPKPPVVEQKRIVRELAAAETRHRAIGSAIDRQITLLRERRQALITAAVTGMLQVPAPATANAVA